MNKKILSFLFFLFPFCMVLAQKKVPEFKKEDLSLFAINEKAPDFKLKNLEGKKLTGKLQIISFAHIHFNQINTSKSGRKSTRKPSTNNR
jgi:hypothetical protein